MLRRSATLLVATAIFAACASSTPAPEVVPGRPLPSIGAAATALRHDGDLRLTEDQRTALQRIQRSVDSVNAPLRVRLDSLRPAHRPVNPNDLSVEQREEIRARRAAVRDIVRTMRQNAAPFRGRVVALLTTEQQAKLADYEDEERRRESEPGPSGG